MPKKRSTKSSAPIKADIQLESWPIGRLKPYERNPRKNDGEPVEKMVDSIRQFGFTVPVLAHSSGEVIDGHLRLKAAKHLRLDVVPVIVCDSWTPEQVKAFRLLVNRSVNWAEWDSELLTMELLELKHAEFDLSLSGFDGDEIERLLSGGELEPKNNGAGEDSKKITFTAEQYEVIQRWIFDFRIETDDPDMSDGRAIELMLADRNA
jgi:ParB-like chromosome segregation protein Spo0J